MSESLDLGTVMLYHGIGVLAIAFSLTTIFWSSTGGGVISLVSIYSQINVLGNSSFTIIFQRKHLSKPKPKIEMGTQNSDIDYDWIPKEALQSECHVVCWKSCWWMLSLRSASSSKGLMNYINRLSLRLATLM